MHLALYAMHLPGGLLCSWRFVWLVFFEKCKFQNSRSVFCTSQVARIVEVSEEMRRNMGGNSGLELITLPYGHQLRLDLIER